MNLSLSISISSARGAALPFVLSSANIDEDATQTDVVGALSSTFGTGPYTYSIVADPDSKFAISGSNLVVRTAATFNYETATSHSVTIRSTDSLAATEDRVFTISVNNVDDGPTTVGAATTLEAMVGSPVVGTQIADDLRDLWVSPTGQTLTFTVSHGSIAGNGFDWTWTPSTAQFETITVTATDEDGQQASVELGVTVAAANQAPTAGNLTLEFAVPAFGTISAHSTLTTSLISYWDLDEASGNRADSHGSNTLADNNTVTSTAGIGGAGTAALFASANSEYLSITDAAQSGLDLAGPLSMNIWYKPTTNVSTANVIGKWNGGASQASYRGSVSSSGAALGILLSTNGSFQSSNSKNQSITTLTTGTWYMLTWIFDRTAGEVTFYLNGSSVGTATGVTTSALFDGTSDFRIGCTGAGSEFMDAAAQFAGVWSKTLTTQEITDLYNAGAGLPYTA